MVNAKGDLKDENKIIDKILSVEILDNDKKEIELIGKIQAMNYN